MILRTILSTLAFFFCSGNITHHFHQQIFQPYAMGRYASGRYVIRVHFHDKTFFFLSTTTNIITT